MGRTGIVGYKKTLAIAGVLFSACATTPSNTAHPPETARAPALQAYAVPRPAEHIYVTEEDLESACYRSLGEVNYVEPFSAAAIDPDHTAAADALRKAAAEKYPNQVDAIIGMHANDRDVGSEVAVSGEAVQLEPANKIGCTLPKAMAASMVNFAFGGKMRRRANGTDSAWNQAQSTASDSDETPAGSGSKSGKQALLRRALISTLPGRAPVDETALKDRIASQQVKIKSLRAELDGMIRSRCEAADLSASQCDSLEKAAEVKESPATDYPPDNSADSMNVSDFELQNRAQAQEELIGRLQKAVADLKGVPHDAARAGASN